MQLMTTSFIPFYDVANLYLYNNIKKVFGTSPYYHENRLDVEI